MKINIHLSTQAHAMMIRQLIREKIQALEEEIRVDGPNSVTALTNTQSLKQWDYIQHEIEKPLHALGYLNPHPQTKANSTGDRVSNGPVPDET